MFSWIGNQQSFELSLTHGISIGQSMSSRSSPALPTHPAILPEFPTCPSRPGKLAADGPSRVGVVAQVHGPQHGPISGLTLRRIELHSRLLVLGGMGEHLNEDFMPLVNPFD